MRIFRLHVAAAIVFSVGTANDAAAQCPDRLPQSVLDSIRTPEIRNSALTFRIDATLLAQNGGAARMIELSRAQIASTNETIETERRNQGDLARQGMGNDRRALDGRLVIQVSEESNRLTAATIQLLECHARAGGGFGSAATEIGGGPAPSLWNASAAERHTAMAAPMSAASAREALESLTRTMNEQAMAKATPEVAAYYSRLDATRATGEANMAAHDLGRAEGMESGRQASRDAQMKMVTGVVQGWKAPMAYAAGGGAAVTIADPFAAASPAPDASASGALASAIGDSSLVWDAERKIANAGTSGGRTCGGRLRAGDYPVLADGNLLDTAGRIARFLLVCGDASQPLHVLVVSGAMEVR